MSATLPLKTPATAPPTNSVVAWLRVLHRVNPILSLAGWANIVLLIVVLVLLPLDARVVTGAPVWLKPLKFTLSVAAYTWTLGWLLAALPATAQRTVQRISWGVAVCMVVEIGCIFLQAARGTTSHYNVASVFNIVVFQLMGVFILLNTLLTVAALYLVWRYRPHGPASYVWGVRLGLLVFLVGSVLGGAMIGLNRHTVGAPDGGPGLPGLGWSTRAGDLRIAHFLGMHALQALPLLGWWLSRRVPQRAVALTWLGTLLYAGAVALLFSMAMHGLPVMRL